jgi:hypothetical protein
MACRVSSTVGMIRRQLGRRHGRLARCMEVAHKRTFRRSQRGGKLPRRRERRVDRSLGPCMTYWSPTLRMARLLDYLP